MDSFLFTEVRERECLKNLYFVEVLTYFLNSVIYNIIKTNITQMI